MKETVLADVHRALGARMVPFSGWSMPLAYGDIQGEHRAVREQAGLFDLGHMGRVRFRGPDADRLANRVQTYDAGRLPEGRTRYTLIAAEEARILDDALVSRADGGLLLVVNAANLEADLALFRRAAGDLDVEVADVSRELAMIAVQGPASPEALARAGLAEAGRIGYYRLRCLRTDLGAVIVSRTGYTGEVGFELLLPAGRAATLWSRLLETGSGLGLRPCGLGARDTLRLEAGMPLYGHELTIETNPFEVGLGFAVRPHPDALAAVDLDRLRARPPRRRLVGLVVDGPRIPRAGCTVHSGGRPVGRVLSGTRSPTLGLNIATALLEEEAASEGPLAVDIRGHEAPARPTPLPFYKRKE